MTLVGMGAVLPELLAAADVLGDEVDVICVTSADLLFRALRARAGFEEGAHDILGELLPAERAAPLGDRARRRPARARLPGRRERTAR